MGLFWTLFIVAVVTTWSGCVIFGLYSETQKINDLRHVEPSNCTILDAKVVRDADATSWVIHVIYTVPSSHHLPANAKHVSLLEGTKLRTHYAVNQTLPFFISTRNLNTVSLTRKAVDGGNIFGVVILCIMCIPILVAILYGVLFVVTELNEGSQTVYELTISRLGGVWRRVGRIVPKKSIQTTTTRTASADPETYDLEGRIIKDGVAEPGR